MVIQEENGSRSLMQLAKDLTPEGEKVIETLRALLLMTEQERKELRE